MKRKTVFPSFARRLPGLVVAAAVVHGSLLPAQAASCAAGLLQPTLAVADGVETVAAQANGTAVSLRLVRLDPRDWTVRVLDMRDLRQARASRADYTSPAYSLAEVAAIAAPDHVFSSAGMTESYFAPVPAGLLKIAGSVRNRANVSSRILDGVLCVRSDQKVTLLSEMTPKGRRIPQDTTSATASCVHALQAGPVLVDRGQPAIPGPLKPNVARVIAAVDREGKLVLGYSPQATTFGLACLLSAASLRIESAMALQGDELGGLVLGRGSGFGAATWGNANGTIASAIEVLRRGGSSSSRSGTLAPAARSNSSR